MFILSVPTQINVFAFEKNNKEQRTGGCVVL